MDVSGTILFEAWDETALQAVTAALGRQGLRVIRSFDLRSVLAAHAEHAASSGECDCPYHGTAQCTCQFVVLLVYGGAGPPVAVTAHGRDGRARLRLVQDAMAAPDPRLAKQVLSALAGTAASMEKVYDSYD